MRQIIIRLAGASRLDYAPDQIFNPFSTQKFYLTIFFAEFYIYFLGNRIVKFLAHLKTWRGGSFRNLNRIRPKKYRYFFPFIFIFWSYNFRSFFDFCVENYISLIIATGIEYRFLTLKFSLKLWSVFSQGFLPRISKLQNKNRKISPLIKIDLTNYLAKTVWPIIFLAS